MNHSQRLTFLLLSCAAIVVVSAGASPVTWIEAEDYELQRGSTASRFTMPVASGGACVDNDWGGQTGHFLRYKLELAFDSPVLHLTLRYARAMTGDAVVNVTMDGDTNTTRSVRLPSTGDWGVRPQGWMYAAVQLPAAAKGTHTLEIRSPADQNNVNIDGFYLSAEPVGTDHVAAGTPSGPDAIPALGEGRSPLPCKTPLALPYSRRKAFVAGDGTVQSLLSTPAPRGMGHNVLGAGLQTKLAGHGPWQSVEQTLLNTPVPTVLTCLKWPAVEVEQAVFAAAPEERGFFVRITLTNKTATAREFELVSSVRNAGAVKVLDGPRFVVHNQPLLRPIPAPAVTVSTDESALPGPLGGGPQMRHRVRVAAGASAGFDLQFLGDGISRDEA